MTDNPPSFESFTNSPDLGYIKHGTNYLFICMVGLPATGKSFSSQRIQRYIQWYGYNTRLFNLGVYRRNFISPNLEANFFDPNNPLGSSARDQLAVRALQDCYHYFVHEEGQVCILDATNTSLSRREMIREIIREWTIFDHLSILWIETKCDDENLRNQNILKTKLHSPDYATFTNQDDIIADFKKRIQHYELVYQTLTPEELKASNIINNQVKINMNNKYSSISNNSESYIKILNAGKSILQYSVSGFLITRIYFFLMNISLIESNPIYMMNSDEVIHTLRQQWDTHTYNIKTYGRCQFSCNDYNCIPCQGANNIIASTMITPVLLPTHPQSSMSPNASLSNPSSSSTSPHHISVPQNNINNDNHNNNNNNTINTHQSNHNNTIPLHSANNSFKLDPNSQSLRINLDESNPFHSLANTANVSPNQFEQSQELQQHYPPTQFVISPQLQQLNQQQQPHHHHHHHHHLHHDNNSNNDCQSQSSEFIPSPSMHITDAIPLLSTETHTILSPLNDTLFPPQHKQHHPHHLNQGKSISATSTPSNRFKLCPFCSTPPSRQYESVSTTPTSSTVSLKPVQNGSSSSSTTTPIPTLSAAPSSIQQIQSFQVNRLDTEQRYHLGELSYQDYIILCHTNSFPLGWTDDGEQTDIGKSYSDAVIKYLLEEFKLNLWQSPLKIWYAPIPSSRAIGQYIYDALTSIEPPVIPTTTVATTTTTTTTPTSPTSSIVNNDPLQSSYANSVFSTTNSMNNTNPIKSKPNYTLLKQTQLINWRSLAPLSKGLLAGYTEDIMKYSHPQLLSEYVSNKLDFRFPLGESNRDLGDRTERLILELSRSHEPILIIAPYSSLRCLVGYFYAIQKLWIPYIILPKRAIFKNTATAYNNVYNAYQLVDENGKEFENTKHIDIDSQQPQPQQQQQNQNPFNINQVPMFADIPLTHHTVQPLPSQESSKEYLLANQIKEMHEKFINSKTCTCWKDDPRVPPTAVVFCSCNVGKYIGQ